MARFVADASLTLTWCFEDEATVWTDALLARLKSGDEVVVPAHWPVEVGNAILVAIRRGRIPRDKAMRFFGDLHALPIRIDPGSADAALDQVFVLAELHDLTLYDAAYLELAMRAGLPLATLDAELENAAKAEQVPRP